jgi:Ca2+-binding EF-hand superfamily protein
MGKLAALLLIGMITMMPLTGNYVLAQYGTTLETRIEDRFDKMDSDKDGNISRAEYLAYNQKVAEAKFTWIDADGNGFATRTELQEGVRDLMGQVEHKWSKKSIPQ